MDSEQPAPNQAELPDTVVLPEILREVYRTGSVIGPTGESIELRDAVKEQEAEALYRTIRRLEPKLCLEVGLGQGISTLAILAAMEDNGFGEHHVVDPGQDGYQNAGIAMVERSGLSHRFTFHREYPEPVTHRLGALDFVFIDASHLYDLTLAAFASADMKLNLGGVIGFHDMWLPSQQAVLRFILTNRHYVPYEPECHDRLWLSPIWRRALRRLPFAEKIFRQDLLHHWREFGLKNLGFIEKVGWDDRDFDHLEPF